MSKKQKQQDDDYYSPPKFTKTELVNANWNPYQGFTYLRNHWTQLDSDGNEYAAYYEPEKASHCCNLYEFSQEIDNMISGDFDLNDTTAQINNRFYSFVKIGLLAYKVKIYRLWTQDKKLKSFKDYCIKYLLEPVWKINNFIKGAAIVGALMAKGFTRIPRCLSHAVMLFNYMCEHGEAALYKAWSICIDRIDPVKMTSIKIAEILGIETTKKQVRLKKDVYDRLQKKATSQGLTVDELLEELLEDDNETEEVPEDKIEQWQEDLDNLVNEETEHKQQPKCSVSYDNLYERLLNWVLWILQGDRLTDTPSTS